MALYHLPWGAPARQAVKAKKEVAIIPKRKLVGNPLSIIKPMIDKSLFLPGGYDRQSYEKGMQEMCDAMGKIAQGGGKFLPKDIIDYFHEHHKPDGILFGRANSFEYNSYMAGMEFAGDKINQLFE